MLRRAAAAAGVLLTLAVVGLAARSLPIFAVQDVRVSGVTGDQAPRVRAALQRAAEGMTTLDVDEGALRDAVQPYATVDDLEAEADFPRALRVQVRERLPVAVVAGVAVAADNGPLRGVPPTGLPVVRGGPAITDRLLPLLAAAPRELLLRARTARISEDGPVVELRDGPEVRFGDERRPRVKWLAAAAVLADARSRGASYVDVGVPGRPAAGGLPPSASTSG